MIPARYQQRPVQPAQVEAFLLTEDNLQAIADWWTNLRFKAVDVGDRKATVKHVADRDAPVLLIPFSGGWYSQGPGDYLVHFGRGETRGMSAEAFAVEYEAFTPADPSLCSCLRPEAYGSAPNWTGPLNWDRDCKTCGSPLTAEALAQAEAY